MYRVRHNKRPHYFSPLLDEEIYLIKCVTKLTAVLNVNMPQSGRYCAFTVGIFLIKIFLLLRKEPSEYVLALILNLLFRIGKRFYGGLVTLDQ